MKKKIVAALLIFKRCMPYFENPFLWLY